MMLYYFDLYNRDFGIVKLVKFSFSDIWIHHEINTGKHLLRHNSYKLLQRIDGWTWLKTIICGVVWGKPKSSSGHVWADTSHLLNSQLLEMKVSK